MVPYLNMPGCIVLMTVWRFQKVPQNCGALILVTAPLDAKAQKGSRGRSSGVNLVVEWFWLWPRKFLAVLCDNRMPASVPIGTVCNGSYCYARNILRVGLVYMMYLV
jgi:hypothetical protein